MSSRHPSHKAPESIPPQEQESTGIEAEMNPRPDYGEHSYVGHNRLPNKIALVTGGDSGIGRAVCVAFAREGADILCGYHSSDVDAKETKRVVEEAGRRCVLFKGDLSEESDCRAIVEQCVQTFGRIDVLVNNAAFQGKSVENFEDIPLDRVEKTFKTNIYSMFAITKFALPHMKEGSAIINTGSIQAYQPSPGILDYACTKAAIVDFTKGLAPYLIKRGIRVNCVAPGPFWTPLIVQSFPAEKVKEFGRNYPIGRPAMPVELSPAYVFLASSEASYVAGEVLGVTGGKPLA